MVRDGKIFLLMTPAEAEMLAWALITAAGGIAPRNIKWWTELAVSLQREVENAREYSASAPLKIESGIPIPENRGRKRKPKN